MDNLSVYVLFECIWVILVSMCYLSVCG